MHKEYDVVFVLISNSLETNDIKIKFVECTSFKGKLR